MVCVFLTWVSVCVCDVHICSSLILLTHMCSSSGSPSLQGHRYPGGGRGVGVAFVCLCPTRVEVFTIFTPAEQTAHRIGWLVVCWKVASVLICEQDVWVCV